MVIRYRLAARQERNKVDEVKISAYLSGISHTYLN
jgi:hypothetical protein